MYIVLPFCKAYSMLYIPHKTLVAGHTIETRDVGDRLCTSELMHHSLTNDVIRLALEEAVHIVCLTMLF